MTRRTWLGLTLFLHASIICGCRDTSLQAQWNREIAFVAAAVSDLGKSSPGDCLSGSQLVTFLREPDYKLRIDELVPLLPEGRQEHVVNRLREAYAEPAGLTVDQAGPEPLADCQLWVYDESRRFEKPMSSFWCGDFGFSATIFIMREGKALVARSFAFWPGLEGPDKVPRPPE